jgi:general secretion pathway protein J
MAPTLTALAAPRGGCGALGRPGGTATRQVRGFTLVEVLVALFVMALLASMAWQGVDSMLRAREAGQARIERTLRLTTVLAQWEQDLHALHSNTVLPSSLAFDGASLRLVRDVDAGLQLVVWALREGRWQRWASPVAQRGDELQQHWLASQQLQGGEPGQLTVHEGIVDWQVYFFRGNGWSNAQSSDDVIQAQPPPPPASGAGSAPQQPQRLQAVLPSGVRLVLQFADGDNRILTRDVLLGPQQP